MSTVEGYFDYPYRRPGLDHTHFDHRYLIHAPAARWPGDAPIALSIVVPVQHFPIDTSGLAFMPTGGMVRPAPDLWNYTMRDYGNRVGIFRIMKILRERNLVASVPMNEAVAIRYPALLEAIVAQGWEIIANGIDMAHLHHGGLEKATEAAWIEQSFSTLRRLSAQNVQGWLSPERSESEQTLGLVLAQGATYVCDWANDDMPYALRTDSGRLVAMPCTYELDDKRILYTQNQSLAEWSEQIIAAFECLLAEATAGRPRIMSLVLTPWVIGQPYRIRALGRVLDHMLARAPVWNATNGAICEAWEGR